MHLHTWTGQYAPSGSPTLLFSAGDSTTALRKCQPYTTMKKSVQGRAGRVLLGPTLSLHTDLGLDTWHLRSVSSIHLHPCTCTYFMPESQPAVTEVNTSHESVCVPQSTVPKALLISKLYEKSLLCSSSTSLERKCSLVCHQGTKTPDLPCPPCWLSAPCVPRPAWVCYLTTSSHLPGPWLCLHELHALPERNGSVPALLPVTAPHHAAQLRSLCVSKS